VSRAGVVIAGGGLAAQRCCETLRSQGYDGSIRIVSDEPIPPYDRPPLSKELLVGEMTPAEIGFRPRDWYEQAGIELLLGERAQELDPARRKLRLAGGRVLPYDRLLIATGSAPRRLPGAEGFSNVHYLRTLADARALRAALRPGARLAVIGAGFIGQEVAASARHVGADVTIVEALAAPLVRVLGSDLGAWFADLHRTQGVKVYLGTAIERFLGNGKVEELRVAGERRIPCDAVVIGVGIAPATEWLADAGLPPGGVPVDELGRTELPNVFAAGDSALPFDPDLGVHVRSEHWEAAARQGIAAARGMLGLDAAPATLPSFWSDQYGIRIQYLGHADGADQVSVEGDRDSRNFTATFSRAGVPVAALLVGRPHALAKTRRMLTAARAQTAPVRELSAAL
jgi:3-phenylpropionate/trans-cinnamate dioxygenase ferredoxin reductase component